MEWSDAASSMETNLTNLARQFSALLRSTASRLPATGHESRGRHGGAILKDNNSLQLELELGDGR